MPGINNRTHRFTDAWRSLVAPDMTFRGRRFRSLVSKAIQIAAL